ncbi:hypothetical protein Egran_01252 [Elaphomyces granulatus]|uniref:EGF-like calcium-binding domain-containing protein n=1 Tax=Elaphomyces granulatus TaxID=519963 RepID=A0A232M3M9_9EURO|nr:hypothetical protein Egran_01252 [Elaphomyces granulatus]
MKMLLNFASLLLLTTSLVSSSTIQEKRWDDCGTCNPISGQNFCDISTSCINTGSKYHCACRAGYKASPNNNDVKKQFRLEMPNYEFLVFVPVKTPCNLLCDNPFGGPGTLCSEVQEHNECTV